jgi:hypothetical protein
MFLGPVLLMVVVFVVVAAILGVLMDKSVNGNKS